MSRFATISRRNLIMPWKMLALAVLLLGFGNHALAGVIWNLNATFTDGMTASGVFVTDDSMDFTSWDVFFAGGTLAHDFESSSATLPPGAIGVEIPDFLPSRTRSRSSFSPKSRVSTRTWTFIDRKRVSCGESV